ncbi:tyrosine-type recombinase/integrase [Bacillus sp. NTK071]|uniref:tyrosine-type recombinase/integrase n=1 Tax=Bacillus sp. NTK071 TaxID=2802175 RepID=UPI001A8EF855|nr:tyrosine-type recombinase/integrase [Bacillus sp. NTK071]MBN8207531.1 tyrosine-type recombinase/integrase [Bacillus sp. NTK071]
MELFEQTLPEFLEEYLQSLERKGRKASTLRRYRYDLVDFTFWLRTYHRSVDFESFRQLTSERLQEYIRFLHLERHYSERTLKRIMTVLNQVYRYYMSLNRTKNNPMKEVVLPTSDVSGYIDTDFLLEEECEKLLETIVSLDDLTENQLRARAFLIDRNLMIVRLFLSYGLTLQELCGLSMKDVSFEQNELLVTSAYGKRTVHLDVDHKKVLYSYYHTIPAPVRPRLKSDDPLFVSFDFQRQTYRWSYEVDRPKRLTEIAVQKMIRQEVQRAGLRKGVSAQHMRRTCVIRAIENDLSINQLRIQFGMKSDLTLKRYIDYMEKQQMTS